MAAQWKRVAIPPAAINPLILLKGTFFILADTPVAITIVPDVSTTIPEMVNIDSSETSGTRIWTHLHRNVYRS
ncbi:hypothetical protein SAMN05878442_1518 [Vreelandella aquamarina]|nr:hypothetical protein SAMN05878442_1518 [Halomonas meridiana]